MVSSSLEGDVRYKIYLSFVFLLVLSLFLFELHSEGKISLNINSKSLSFTGNMISGGSTNFSDVIDKNFDTNSVYLWSPHYNLPIKSVSVSGNVTGTGSFSLYLVSKNTMYTIASGILYNETLDLDNICVDTCSFNLDSNKKYVLRIELDNVSLFINKIYYSSVDINKANLSLLNNKYNILVGRKDLVSKNNSVKEPNSKFEIKNKIKSNLDEEGDLIAQVKKINHNSKNKKKGLLNLVSLKGNQSSGCDSEIRAKGGAIKWKKCINPHIQDVEGKIIIDDNFIFVNSSALNSSFNSSAELTFHNLTWNEPVIYTDGVFCDDCKIISYTNGTLVFEVNHFSNYTSKEGTNLSIWDDTDSSDKYRFEQIGFYANYTNATSNSSINDSSSYCLFSENSRGTWSTPVNMSYNTDTLLYEIHKIISEEGNYSYNISCFNNIGYANVSVIDDFNLNDSIFIGESGSLTLSNFNQENIEFKNNYDSVPLIIATPVTQNGSLSDVNNSLIPLIDSINRTGFSMRLCKDGGSATCDTSVNEEKVDYFVFSMNSTLPSWIQIGKVDATTNGAKTNITFNKFREKPLIFTQAQTYNQGGSSLSATSWVTDISTESANIIGCTHQGTSNNCDSSNPSESFGWVAIDSNYVNFLKSIKFSSGSVSQSNSRWKHVDTGKNYVNQLVMVTTNSDIGGQDPKYPWARNLNGSSCDVRYCEQDGANDCDTHVSEDISWFSLEQGNLISYKEYPVIITPINPYNDSKLNQTLTIEDNYFLLKVNTSDNSSCSFSENSLFDYYNGTPMYTSNNLVHTYNLTNLDNRNFVYYIKCLSIKGIINNESNQGKINISVNKQYPNVSILTNTSHIKTYNFSSGNISDVFFNRSDYGIQLNNSLTGIYQSPIMYISNYSHWENITWVSNTGSLSSQGSNNIDTDKMLLLMHFDNDTLSGENKTYFKDYALDNDGQGINFEGDELINGKFEGGLSFDGVDDYVNISSFRASGKNISVSIWVNWSSIISSSSEPIIGACLNSSGGDGWGLWYNQNEFQFFINDRNSNYASINASLNGWNNIVGVYNGSSIDIYLNGVKGNSSIYSQDLNQTGNLLLGFFDSQGDYLSASVDELIIWNRSLDDEEIDELYKRGTRNLNLSIRSCDDELCDNESWIDVKDMPDQKLFIDDSKYFQYKFEFSTNLTNNYPKLYNTTINTEFSENNSPIINLLEPQDNSNNITRNVLFKYNVTDESSIENCSLYSNMSGVWKEELYNVSINSNTNLFREYNLSDGLSFVWNVVCYDSYGNRGVGINRTITLTSNPEVDLISPYDNYIDSDGNVLFVYNVSSQVNVDNCSLYFNDGLSLDDEFNDGVLDSSWNSKDILTTYTGSTNEGNGVLNISGSGSDIFMYDDSFRYVYKNISGNFTAIIKVLTLDGPEPWSKVGLMVRGNTSSNAHNIFILRSRDNGQSFQYRNDSDTQYTLGNSGSLPVYLKLIRSGDYFEGYESSDGSVWTQVGSSVLNVLDDNVLVGVAVTAHSDGRYANSTIDYFRVENSSYSSGIGYEINQTDTSINIGENNFYLSGLLNGSSYEWGVLCNDNYSRSSFSTTNNSLSINSGELNYTSVNSLKFRMGDFNISSSSYVTRLDGIFNVKYNNSKGFFISSLNIEKLDSGETQEIWSQVFVDNNLISEGKLRSVSTKNDIGSTGIGPLYLENLTKGNHSLNIKFKTIGNGVITVKNMDVSLLGALTSNNSQVLINSYDGTYNISTSYFKPLFNWSINRNISSNSFMYINQKIQSRRRVPSELPDNGASTSEYNMTDNVMLLHFNNLSSNMTPDTSGHNNNATCSIECPKVSAGLFNNSLYFDGVGDSLEVADTTDINLGNNHENVTLEIWFKPENKSNVNKQVLFEQGAGVRGLNIFLEDGLIYIGGWNTKSSESGWSGNWISSGEVKNNKWNQVVLVLDNGTETTEPNKLKMYLNGGYVGSVQGSELWGHTGDISVGWSDGNSRYPGGTSSSSNYFKGYIDEVAYYARALSEKEVSSHYSRITETITSYINTSSEISSPWERYISGFDDTGSATGLYVTDSKVLNNNYSIFSKNSNDSLSSIINQNLLVYDLIDNNSNVINHFYLGNSSLDGTGNFNISSGSTILLKKDITLKKGDGFMIFSSLSISSETGSFTPRMYVSSPNISLSNCYSEKERFLESTQDIGNVFLTTICNNLTTGKTYEVDLSVEVPAGDILKVRDSSFSVIETKVLEEDYLNVPPTPNKITNPDEGSYKKGVVENVTWYEFDDDDGDFSHYEIRLLYSNNTLVDELELNTSNLYTLINYSSYLEGSYIINVTGCDNSSLCTSSANNFIIDLTNPNVSLNSPDNNSNFTFKNVSISNVNISCNVSDNILLSNLSFYLKNSSSTQYELLDVYALSGTSNSLNYTIDNLDQETYTWKCVVKDKAGNENSSKERVFNVLIGNQKPQHANPILNSSNNQNTTNENLTCYNQSTLDLDGDSVKNIYNWYLNGSYYTLLNMPFESGSNSTWTRDYSLELNGSVNGPTYVSSAGFDGMGTYFFNDSNNEYIQVPDTGNYFDFTGPFSVTAWIKTTHNPNFLDGIVTKAASSPYEWTFRFYDDAFQFTMDSTFLETTWVPTIGQWYFVAGVWNGTHMNLYINDTLVANTSRTSAPTATSDPVLIGMDYTTTSGRTFPGYIDDVKIFNRSLSNEQISLLFNKKSNQIVSQDTNIGDNWSCSVVPTDGIYDGDKLFSNNLTIVPFVNHIPTHTDPILNSSNNQNTTDENLTCYNQSTSDIDGDSVKNIYNWYLNGSYYTLLNMPFEGGSNSTWTRDYSLGLNGSVNGSTYFSSAGFDGMGTYLFDDSNNEYIQISDTGNYFDFTGPFSITAWIKTTHNPNSYDGIVTKAASPPYEWIIRFNSNTFQFAMDSTTVQTTWVPTIGQWYFVAGVWNGTHMNLYVNDTLVANTSRTSAPTSTSDPVLIGMDYTTTSGRTFPGYIDDVEIYNYSLTDNQIKSLSKGKSDVIVSDTTNLYDTWSCSITPNDGSVDGLTLSSNNLTIINLNTAPNTTQLILNSSLLGNKTSENLTCYAKGLDAENSSLNAYYRWYNGSNLFSQGQFGNIQNDSLTLITTLNSSNTEKSENWTCSILFSDGSLNESGWNNKSLIIVNSLPSIPDLLRPSTGNVTINRTPLFEWNNSDDDDNDVITYELILNRIYCANLGKCSVPFLNITTSELNITPSVELDIDSVYNWSVRACDSEGCSNYSLVRNITINSLKAISLPINSVEFGIVKNNDINDTVNNDPGPMLVQNDGNVEVNVSLYSNISIWHSSIAGLNTSYFQFKIDNSSELNSFNYTESKIIFTNISNSEIDSVIGLKYGESQDSAQIDLKIHVPLDESSGTRSTNIYVLAK